MNIANISEQEWEAIEYCIDNFDFERVHIVMEFLDWGWVTDSLEDIKVPSLTRLITAAQKSLMSVCADKLHAVGHGGFVARRYAEGDELIRLELVFELTNWDWENDEIED